MRFLLYVALVIFYSQLIKSKFVSTYNPDDAFKELKLPKIPQREFSALMFRTDRDKMKVIIGSKYAEKHDIESIIYHIRSMEETDMKVLAYEQLYMNIIDDNPSNVYLMLLANHIKFLTQTDTYQDDIDDIYRQTTDNIINALPPCIRVSVFQRPFRIYNSRDEQWILDTEFDFLEKSINFGIYHADNPFQYFYPLETFDIYTNKRRVETHGQFWNLSKNAQWFLEPDGDYCYIKSVGYEEYLHYDQETNSIYTAPEAVTEDSKASFYFLPANDS